MIKFKDFNNKVKGKCIITNLPNSLYWGRRVNNTDFELCSRWDANAANAAIMGIYAEDGSENFFAWWEDGLVIAAYLTGFFQVGGNKTYYEVAMPAPISWHSKLHYRGYIEVYHDANLVQAWRMATPNSLGFGTSVVNDQISNLLDRHRIIQDNNVLCARIINTCRAKGISLPNNVVPRLKELQDYIVAVDYVIRKTVKGKEVRATTYNSLDTRELVRLTDSAAAGIGALPAIGTGGIIVALIFLASLGLTIWLLCMKYNPSTKVAFKYSNDLTAELIRYLPKDVYNQLMKENAKFERIANETIQNTAGLGTIKTIALLAGGFILTKFIIDNYNINRKPQTVKAAKSSNQKLLPAAV